ncbi:MAG: LysR family transcriptional regulator [Deferribacterales bacterium]
MDINQLRIFLTIAKTGNLTRASEQLFISQPAVSAQLKMLEGELGFQLFIRTPKGMKLTENGTDMLDEAQRIVDSCDNMLSNAKSLSEKVMSHLNIGLNTEHDILRIEELVKHASEDKNPLHLRLIQTRSEDIIRDLTSDMIDAGFFYGDISSKQIEYITLTSYPLKIVYPPKWEKDVQNADAEALAKFPWIWTTEACPFSRSSAEYFMKKGTTPNRIMYVDDEMLIGKLVNSEIGCSILTEPVAEKLRRDNIIGISESLDTDINLNFGYMKAKRNSDEISSAIRIIKSIWGLKS